MEIRDLEVKHIYIEMSYGEFCAMLEQVIEDGNWVITHTTPVELPNVRYVLIRDCDELCFHATLFVQEDLVHGDITPAFRDFLVDQEDEPKEIWDVYGIPDVINALLEWGNGSGEELFDHLTTKGLTPDEAHTVMNLLNKTCKE